MRQGSFDAYASAYDTEFTFSVIGSRQRELVYDYVKPLLQSSDAVLELNCGTGYDASKLHSFVKRYHATDVSEEMIKTCIKKHGQLQGLDFELLDLKDHHRLASDFSVVFSNFGGLNCLSPDQLRSFFESTSAAKGTDYYLVIMGRNCLWERSYFWYKNKKKERLRRSSGDACEVIIKGRKINTWYYSPLEVSEMASPSFKVIRTVPVGFFLPPSYLDNKFNNRKLLSLVLFYADRLISRSPFLADYADHYLIHLRRT